jgi:predicted alpha-1,6-mannanase (GH76 family)
MHIRMRRLHRGISLGLVQMLLIGLFVSVIGFEDVRPASAFTSGNADTALNAWINTFWDSNKKYFYTNSDRQIHSHAHGPENGLYTDFWWEAQLWEVVMDAYQRTNSSTYRTMIDQVYDGFQAYHPNFDNNFNDDQCWWALASARAFEITGATRYRDRAIDLFDRITNSTELDSTYGGGVWWRKSPHDQKNVATNGCVVLTGAKIYNFNRSANGAYLTKAQNVYNWLKSRLVNGGEAYDHVEGGGSGTVIKWNFTYNNGNMIGAAMGLYEATNTASYMTDATNFADWAVNNLTNGGTLLHEGENDGGGFKMILARNLNRLVTQHGKSQYLGFLRNNATQAWNHRRTSDNLIGSDWSAPTGSGYIQSLTAAAGVAIMQFTSPDNVTGLLAENGTYEAENARRNGTNTENTTGGYTGRGYIAGWNSSGTSVKFNVNIGGSGGTYRLDLRYAGGAGNASRKIIVNGSTVANNFSFAGTGGWGSWATVSQNNVTLNAGYNSVEVAYDSGAGSNNWLNLDKVTLVLTGGGGGGTTYQAENGTLHSISVESTQSGYNGTGYLAGWNSDGQWVDIGVNVASSGNYTLVLRYAAAAGNATRYIHVNGNSIVNNQTFNGTGSWSSWSTVTISNVPLNASKGSSNWLNLDQLTVQ